MEEKYEVFVKIDEFGTVIGINSSAFLSDTRGWIKIDEGMGDKYHHAQNNYLDKPLYELTGSGVVYNYKLVDGEVVYSPGKA